MNLLALLDKMLIKRIQNNKNGCYLPHTSLTEIELGTGVIHYGDSGQYWGRRGSKL